MFVRVHVVNVQICMYTCSVVISFSLCACVSERDGHLPAVCVYVDMYAYTCESVNRFTLPASGSAGAGGGRALSLRTAGRARPGTTRRRSV